MSDETVTDDKKYCESIASSIVDIIRFSLNEEYRKKSCELFGVCSTKDTEKEISRRLMSILQNSKKRRKKSKKNKENVEEPNDISNEKTVEETSSTDSGTLSQSSSQRNWLQISSEKYRDVVKRKKSQFHSQPQPCQSDFEFSGCNIRFTNSQPASSATGGMDSLSGGSKDGSAFCKKRFKESFEDNAGKYLRKNLTSNKRIRY